MHQQHPIASLWPLRSVDQSTAAPPRPPPPARAGTARPGAQRESVTDRQPKVTACTAEGAAINMSDGCSAPPSGTSLMAAIVFGPDKSAPERQTKETAVRSPAVGGCARGLHTRAAAARGTAICFDGSHPLLVTSMSLLLLCCRRSASVWRSLCRLWPSSATAASARLMRDSRACFAACIDRRL